MRILVTGGTGYIGSHTVLSLQEAGHEVVVIDNLVNSSEESLRRVAELSGKNAEFHHVDLVDEAAVDKVFAGNSIDAVIHFAGLKAVGESVREPLKYYYNNLVGTLNLIRVMDRHDVRSIVFSSSATVYGEHNPIPYVEKMEIGANNPYGRTKEQIEDILSDLGRRRSPAGTLHCCATSTRWARTRPAASAKTPRASRTTWCPSSPRWPWAAARSSWSSAATTIPRTAPACVTTSTWWTSPKATWPP